MPIATEETVARENKELEVRFIIRFYNLEKETVQEWWTRPMLPEALRNQMKTISTLNTPVFVEGAFHEYVGNKDYWDKLVITPAMFNNPNLLISWGIKGDHVERKGK